MSNGNTITYVVTNEMDGIEDPNDVGELAVVATTPAGDEAWSFNITDLYAGETRYDGVEVHVADDAIEAFAVLSEFFTALGQRRPSSVDEVRGILDELGVQDGTPRASAA